MNRVSAAPRKTVRPRRRAYRPLLERLEDRLALAAFAVTTTDDTVAVDLTTGKDANGHISLRSAIAAANNTTDADTIVLAKTTYTLDQQDNFWYGPNGLPAISSDVTIEGNGAIIERDSSAPKFRLFYISSGLSGLSAGALALHNLTLRGGLAQGGNGYSGGGGGAGMGGAIFNQGSINLVGVSVSDNSALGGAGGGGILAGVGGGGGGGMGSDGGAGGGGFGGSLGGSFGGSGGASSASGGGGGGGFVSPGNAGLNGIGGQGGDLTTLGGRGGLVSGNNPNRGSGGAGGNGSPGAAGGNFGSGGLAGATGGGGGVGGGGGGASGENGSGAGGGGFGGGGGGGGDQNTLHAGFAGEGGFGGGGGYAPLNPPLYGGTGPSRFGGGSGAFGSAGGGAGMGGAIFNDAGTLQATNSTFSLNSARGGDGGGAGSGMGGAIFNLNGAISLVSSTIAGNSVAAGSGLFKTVAGGQLYNLAFGDRILADGPLTATVTMLNSILADSVGTDDLTNKKVNGAVVNMATVNAAAPNIVETMSDAGEATTDSSGIIAADPNLAPLQDNGGPTPTMALLAGSPAIGAGDPALEHTLDQRGIRRFASVDMGAAAYYVWHNLQHDVDVNGDGNLAPNDALDVINLLNANLPVSAVPKDPSTGPRFYDVNNDGFIAANDALAVINAINAGAVLPPAGGEGEALAHAADDLFAVLAADIALLPKRQW